MQGVVDKSISSDNNSDSLLKKIFSDLSVLFARKSITIFYWRSSLSMAEPILAIFTPKLMQNDVEVLGAAVIDFLGETYQYPDIYLSVVNPPTKIPFKYSKKCVLVIRADDERVPKTIVKGKANSAEDKLTTRYKIEKRDAFLLTHLRKVFFKFHGNTLASIYVSKTKKGDFVSEIMKGLSSSPYKIKAIPTKENPAYYRILIDNIDHIVLEKFQTYENFGEERMDLTQFTENSLAQKMFIDFQQSKKALIETVEYLNTADNTSHPSSAPSRTGEEEIAASDSANTNINNNSDNRPKTQREREDDRFSFQVNYDSKFEAELQELYIAKNNPTDSRFLKNDLPLSNNNNSNKSAKIQTTKREDGPFHRFLEEEGLKELFCRWNERTLVSIYISEHSALFCGEIKRLIPSTCTVEARQSETTQYDRICIKNVDPAISEDFVEYADLIRTEKNIQANKFKKKSLAGRMVNACPLIPKDAAVKKGGPAVSTYKQTISVLGTSLPEISSPLAAIPETRSRSSVRLIPSERRRTKNPQDQDTNPRVESSSDKSGEEVSSSTSSLGGRSS